MKTVSAIRMILRSVGIVEVALTLAVGVHVSPASADDTDPTFEPLVVNSIFKPKPTKTILEPQGITSLLARKTKAIGVSELIRSLKAPSLEKLRNCVSGESLLYGRKLRERIVVL